MAPASMAVRSCFWGFIKQEVGEAFVSAVGNRAARCAPREQAFFDLDALVFGLGLCETDPRDFGFGSCNFLPLGVRPTTLGSDRYLGCKFKTQGLHDHQCCL